LANEHITRIAVRSAIMELNPSEFFRIIIDKNMRPHRKVVIIKDTGVKGLFHEITEGII
jgi:hypothetical protein